MGYGEFKEEVRKALEEFYGEGAEVKLGAALKNNGMRRDAVSIQMNGRGGGTAMFIYLEGFFRAYNAGEMDLEECIKEIVGLNEGNR